MQEKTEDYKKFISQLHALPRPPDQQKPRSNLEVYGALQFDFPLVTEPELAALTDEIAKKSIDAFLKDYHLTKALLKALIHGTDSKTEAHLRDHYSRFSAYLFTKLLTFILRTTDTTKVDFILSFYEVEQESHIVPPASDTLVNEHSSAAPSIKALDISKEDPDDFVYEPIEDSAPLVSSAPQPSSASAEQRLEDLISQISYSLFAGGGSMWEDLRLTEEFCAILASTSSRYWRTAAPLVLVLRDRVAAVPTSLPSVLPTVVNVLKNSTEIVSGEPNHRVFLSFVLGAQRQQKTVPKSLLQAIASAVLPELPYLASVVLSILDTTTQRTMPLDLISDLTSIIAVTSVVVEQLGVVAADSVLRTGLFRDLLRIFLKFFTQSREMETFEQALLRLCFHSQKLATFLSQVPEFVSVIKSPFCVEQYLPDRVLWLLLFSLQETVPGADDFFKEACSNLRVLVEIRVDLPLLSQLKLLQRVATNISILHTSCTPLWTAPLVRKQPTLRSLLIQLQTKLKELQKRAPDGALVKKENKLIAQLLDSLKHVLDESCKKD